MWYKESAIPFINLPIAMPGNCVGREWEGLWLEGPQEIQPPFLVMLLILSVLTQTTETRSCSFMQHTNKYQLLINFMLSPAEDQLDLCLSYKIDSIYCVS